jgi:uncharacterized protein (DUF305 family)
MTNDHKAVLALSALAGILIGWTMNGINQAQNTSNPSVSVGTMLTNPTASLEKYFLEQMIPHHQGAIDMATIALQKSETDEVRGLSEAIIASQQAEIDQMIAWLKDWHNVNYGASQAGMDHSMHSTSGDLTALNRAKNFDTEFVRQMIPHHESAVIMAQMLLAGNPRPELKALAENIISAQQIEINDMKSWLARWTR